jgi:hypothetical protein
MSMVCTASDCTSSVFGLPAEFIEAGKLPAEFTGAERLPAEFTGAGKQPVAARVTAAVFGSWAAASLLAAFV